MGKLKGNQPFYGSPILRQTMQVHVGVKLRGGRPRVHALACFQNFAGPFFPGTTGMRPKLGRGRFKKRLGFFSWV